MRVKNSSNVCESWKIYHVNIRGFQSKVTSFENIVQSLKPSVITFNETQLKNKNGVKLKGYTSFSTNRVNKDGGGVATSVVNSERAHFLKVFESEKDNDLIITRHGQFQVPINIINIYGQVESRSTKDQTSERWNDILEQVSKIEAKGEFVILIGDFNAHLGSLEGNKKKTYGGKLIDEFLETGNYELINASSKSVGGPYTRYDPSDKYSDSKKSILDLCIVSKQLSKHVETLFIDKDMLFTPYRVVGSKDLIYTDHYALILTLTGLPVTGS